MSVLTRALVRGTGLAALLVAAPVAEAQPRRLPMDDSTGAYVAMASRHLWRNVTLSPDASVLTGIAVPLRRELMLEYEGGSAVRFRDANGSGDQHSLALHLQRPLSGAPHPSSVVIGLAGISNPWLNERRQRGLPHGRAEATVSLLKEIGIPSRGIRTVALRLDGAQDIARSHSTWVQGSAAASAGATLVSGTVDHVVTLTGTAAASVGNLGSPLLDVRRPGFGYHSTNLCMTMGYRRRDPASSVTYGLALEATEAFRAAHLGRATFVLALRGSVLLL